MSSEDPDSGAAPTSSPATPRVPLWLAAFVVVLLVLVLVLAGILIRAKIDERGGGVGNAAIEALEREARTSDDPRVFLELGYEYRKAGLLDDALRANRRVLELDVRSVAAHYHIGSILLAQGDEDKAEESFWKGLEIDPTHAVTAKALGELYAARGEYRSLLVAVEPAAKASPELADLQYLLGLGLEKTGDTSGAAQAYRDALDRDSDLTQARAALDRLGVDR